MGLVGVELSVGGGKSFPPRIVPRSTSQYLTVPRLESSLLCLVSISVTVFFFSLRDYNMPLSLRC